MWRAEDRGEGNDGQPVERGSSGLILQCRLKVLYQREYLLSSKNTRY
jgi:hypothetical protein